jgi:hypothetical protein
MPALLVLAGVLLGTVLALAAVTGSIWLQTPGRCAVPGMSEAGATATRPGLAHPGSEEPLMQLQAYPTRLGLEPNQPEHPVLHWLCGAWTVSCPTCGFQLASSRSQARAERRGRRRSCPVCHQERS